MERKNSCCISKTETELLPAQMPHMKGIVNILLNPDGKQGIDNADSDQGPHHLNNGFSAIHVSEDPLHSSKGDIVENIKFFLKKNFIYVGLLVVALTVLIIVLAVTLGTSSKVKMPRVYKRKTNRASWTQEELSNACQAIIEDKMKIRTASRTYNIPEATLRRRILKKDFEKGALGFQSYLGLEAEHQLVNCIKNLQAQGFPPTRKKIREMAFDIARLRGLRRKFNEEKKLAGREWIRSFLKRNPSLNIPEDRDLGINSKEANEEAEESSSMVLEFIELEASRHSEVQSEENDLFSVRDQSLHSKQGPSSTVDLTTSTSVISSPMAPLKTESYEIPQDINSHHSGPESQSNDNRQCRTSAEASELCQSQHRDSGNYTLAKDITYIDGALQKLNEVSENFHLLGQTEDRFDHFGMYVVSLLRGLPPQKALMLQNKIIDLILESDMEPEHGGQLVQELSTQVFESMLATPSSSEVHPGKTDRLTVQHASKLSLQEHSSSIEVISVPTVTSQPTRSLPTTQTNKVPLGMNLRDKVIDLISETHIESVENGHLVHESTTQISESILATPSSLEVHPTKTDKLAVQHASKLSLQEHSPSIEVTPIPVVVSQPTTQSNDVPDSMHFSQTVPKSHLNNKEDRTSVDSSGLCKCQCKHSRNRDCITDKKYIDDVLQKLNEIPEKFGQIALREDGFDHFGKYLASHLRCLPSQTAFVLQKKVKDLILESHTERVL